MASRSASDRVRGGLDIHTYPILPPGKWARSLPAIIVPHGGPVERDQMQFDWLAQFLATRGYAGSAGAAFTPDLYACAASW